MTRKHTRRTPRPLYVPFTIATNQATRLTAAELAQVIAPLRTAASHLRQGTASEDHFATVVGSLHMAQSIEQQGVVRGLAGHLAGIDAALTRIGHRANEGGTWAPPTLYFHEIEAIALLLDLHEFQIQQLSFREYRRAFDLTAAHVRAAGLPLHLVGAAGVPA